VWFLSIAVRDISDAVPHLKGQACVPRLAGEAERLITRHKDTADLNGDVFLQQRDEAALVARSALSDIVGCKGRGGSGKHFFRIKQVLAA
jgi:hypothetical protein